jgi:signal transduction histidine kinase
VSSLVVAAAFVLSAVGVLSLLRHSLYKSAANTAQAQATDLASVITARGVVPHPLLITEEDMAAQLLGPAGTVISSTRNIRGQAAILDVAARPGKVITVNGVDVKVRRFSHVDLDLDDRFVVAALGVRTKTFSGTVLVAYSLGAADHAIGVVEASLGAALPVLMLIVGVLVWALSGWALRPVGAIRAKVAEITATDLRQRVPEPAAHDEIRLLALTMNAMLSRLESSTDRQRQLVADVAHELRNPLAALQAQLEVAAAHPGDATGALLDGSVADVKRMSNLVEDLLTLARIDEKMLRLRPTEVDLDDLALAQAARLRAMGKVAVSVRGVTGGRVLGDEAQLTRVVANLADNAQRHARRRVEFAVVPEGEQCQLSVSDDGPGVPWFERERIFERFVRLDAARAHDGTGAGLGLAIVREIVTAHHGDVWVEDAHPGARFVVRLPVEGWRGPTDGGTRAPAPAGAELVPADGRPDASKISARPQ